MQTLVDDGALLVELPAPAEFPVGPARALSVRSGSHRLPVTATYSPVDLHVRYQLLEPPFAALLYTVELEDDALFALDGRRIQPPEPLSFRLDATPDPATWLREPAAAVPFEPAIAPLLARCAACHRVHDGLVFDWDSLVLQTSDSEPRLYLVEPGAPENSVLLRRLLPDYSTAGQQMPPYWSDVPPLTLEEARLIEQWIAGGAAR